MDKSKKQQMERKFSVSKIALFTCAALAALNANAGDLKLKPTVSSDLIFQDIDSDTRGEREVTTLRIEPSINAIYVAKRASASVNATATHLERDNDIFTSKDDYLEYSYNGELEAITRLLTLSAYGQSRYLNTNVNNFLVADELTNANDLTRTQTNNVEAATDFRRNPWVAGTASVTYSKVETDDNAAVSANRLNNDTLSLAGTLIDGSEIQGFKWNVFGNYSDTDRSESNMGNFESHEVEGFIDRLIYGRWAFRVNGRSESYAFSSQGDFVQNDREFDSYGAGVAYRKADDRYLALTINKASSSNPDEDGEVFPVVSVNWAFTTRTSLDAQFGKRFYGDSASFRFRHATRKIRTSITYTEDVRNSAQFLNDNNNTNGVFVCPGSGFSPDCYQPPSLSVDLGEGEQFVQLGENNNSFEDSVILRKAGSFEMSYQSRVLTVGVFARYNKDDFLGEGFKRETESYGINANYRVGAFTRLSSRFTIADISREDELGNDGSGENYVFDLNLQHTFSPYVNTTVGYSYTNSDGNYSQNVLGNQYTEHRLQLGVTYRFR